MIARMLKDATPQIDMPAVFARVEAVRATTGLNQRDFSLSFGLDPSSYSKMKEAKKPLKSEHAFALAARWGVTMDFIYLGDLSRISEPLRAQIINSLNHRSA